MSADLLARKVVERLISIRDDKVQLLRRCKPRAPIMSEQGVVQASTAEEIALYAVDVNATIDALNTAIDTVKEEFKKLNSPETEQKQEEPQARSGYG